MRTAQHGEKTRNSTLIHLLVEIVFSHSVGVLVGSTASSNEIHHICRVLHQLGWTTASHVGDNQVGRIGWGMEGT